MAHPDEMIQLVKQRSYAACIKEGFRLVADNPWKLFRSTWPYLLFADGCLWIYYIASDGARRSTNASLYRPARRELRAAHRGNAVLFGANHASVPRD